MRYCVSGITMLSLVMIGQLAMGATSPDLKVGVTVLRDNYHLGEPIALVESMKNTTSKDVQVTFGHPEDTGVTFTCKDVPSTAAAGSLCQNQQIVYCHVASGKEVRKVVALNRFLRFTKPGKFTIDYLAEFAGPIVGEKEGEYTVTRYKTKGSFSVTIEAGAIDEDWIKELIAVLGQKPGTKNESQEADRLSKQEAAELLCWADTPLVIEPLIAATKDKDDSLVNISPDVIRALQKFFKKEERARIGILEVAKEHGYSAFQAAVSVYEAEEVPLPRDWLKSILAGRGTGRIWKTLKYLEKHGTSEDLPLAEPLTKSKNKAIAELAARVLKTLESRKPPVPDKPAEAGCHACPVRHAMTRCFTRNASKLLTKLPRNRHSAAPRKQRVVCFPLALGSQPSKAAGIPSRWPFSLPIRARFRYDVGSRRAAL
jgi:hypothetical protein